MNPVARMLLSLSLGLAVYAFYWKLLGYWLGKTAHVLHWRSSDYALRQKRVGITRIYFGWALAFLTYAIAIEDSGRPFSSFWWQETLLGGDWIGVLLFSAMMSFAEWHRAGAPTRRSVTQNDSSTGESASTSP